MITASKAIQNTKDFKIELSDILHDIETASSKGKSAVYYMKNIPDDLTKILEAEGFEVKNPKGLGDSYRVDGNCAFCQVSWWETK